MELFGWEIAKKKDDLDLSSFAPKETDDGAMVVTAGGTYGTYLDMEGSAKTEAELVVKYREMALQPECEKAVDEVTNEAIVKEGNDKIVTLNLDDIKSLNDKIKKIVQDEFDGVTQLLNFNNYGYEIFRRWYVDGRLYYHVMIDENNPEQGIQELRYIDPRKIRKVRLLTRERKGQIYINRNTAEFYVYNEKGFKATGSTGMDNQGLRISTDSILHCTSGLMDKDGKLVLSYIHKAIKPLNQLRILEDATVIYRISRAPERRVFYIDVGQMPKMKAEQHMRDMMVKHKNRLIYDASTGAVRDDRKFACYALDTKIPLLDGRTLTIEEIISEYNQGRTNWVYSCDPITGKFYPGPISWAGITKKESDVVRVTFDNGKSVVCTPDHKFPVWNKGFIEAKDLQVGESLIPGYRRTNKVANNSKEYEQIYLNDTKTWEFTHREVAKWKDDLGLTETKVYKDHTEDFSVVHHLDFNRMNNNPENLVYMGYLDHWLYHTENQTIRYTDTIIGQVVNMLSMRKTSDEILYELNSNEEIISEWMSLNSENHVKNKNFDHLIKKDLVKISKICGFETWNKMRSSLCPPKDQIRRNLTSQRGSDEWKQKLSQARIGIVSKSKTWKIFNPNGDIEIVENLNEYCSVNNLNRTNIKGQFGSRGYKAEILNNHKVISVEFLDEKTTVAALTIDQEETYHSHHTYLLDAGVYTKNTMLEDYWLPRREGQNGTEITTLPSGQNLGKLEDVEYFEKKLYRALNVPVSRLNPDESGFSLGQSDEISRDELSFQKFIDRLRLRFSALLLGALEKQLILKKVFAQSDWDEIKDLIHFDYARDNYFAELKDTEILLNRVGALAQIQPFLGMFYSQEWVKKNVLFQTDNDIKEMSQQMEKESKEMAERGLNPDGTPMMMGPEDDDQGGFGSDSSSKGSAPSPEPKKDSGVSSGNVGGKDAEPAPHNRRVPKERKTEIVQGPSGPFTRQMPVRRNPSGN